MNYITYSMMFALVLPIKAAAFEITQDWDGKSGQRFIHVRGPIEAGDARALRAHLKSKPDPAVVIFNSPGGSVTEALEIGRDIRRHGAITYVGPRQRCVSACLLAFAGGTQRHVNGEGALGSHQFYWPDGKAPAGADATAISQRISASVLRHFISLDVDPEALTLIMETPPEDMLVFTPELLKKFRLTGSSSSFSMPLTVIPEGSRRPGCPFPENYLNSDPLNLYPACRG